MRIYIIRGTKELRKAEHRVNKKEREWERERKREREEPADSPLTIKS